VEKIDIVLVILNKELLDITIKNLNFERVNLLAIVMNENSEEEENDERFFMAGDDKVFQLGEEQILVKSFHNMKGFIPNYNFCYFLIAGYENNIYDVSKIKKFLISNGLSEERVINFEISSQLSKTWLANLKHVEEHGADFFATGDEYMRDGLNLNFIPRVHAKKSECLGGAILADSHQDLYQSYLTAEHVFKNGKAGTVKFVLIGLSPNSFHYDNTKDFTNCAKNFQYVLALNLAKGSKQDHLLKNLISDEVKNDFLSTTSEQADLNFNAIKNTLNKKLSIEEIIAWEDDSQSLTPACDEKNIQTLKNYIELYKKNVQILKNYIELCFKNGSKPIGVVFPFAKIARDNYNKELLAFFRETIQQIEKEYDFTCIDYFDHLGYDCFYDMTHLNLRGNLLMNAVISMRLNAANFIPVDSFLDMNYSYFQNLSLTASKKEYNALMTRIFVKTVKKIRRKNNIKVGFIITALDQWCGDDLYNLFANDKRFKVAVFPCLTQNNYKNKLAVKEFQHGVMQFKQRKLKVIGVDENTNSVPALDVIISLTLDFDLLPKVFSSEILTPKTLIAYIPHGFGLTLPERNYYNSLSFRILWKIFFPSTIEKNIYDKEVLKGAFKSIYSGYIQADIFFKDEIKFQFDWKMARPDARKLIYAPHYSTNIADKKIFIHNNCQFIYEFAKNHPEISWVIKPQQVLFSAAKENISYSEKEYEEYLHQWDELPNAQVYTGAYYQDIFATSEGMIHDGNSLIVEYQFVDKPMIYLTHKGKKFNDIEKAILKASYLVDEKNLKGIVETIEKVFIGGDDYKATERKEVYDKYLNYPKANGMLASEFIYHSIADELKNE